MSEYGLSFQKSCLLSLLSERGRVCPAEPMAGDAEMRAHLSALPPACVRVRVRACACVGDSLPLLSPLRRQLSYW